MSLIRFTIVALIGCICLAGGCDTVHGVSRSIPLDSIPSADAVEQAVRGTPGVKEVVRRDIAAANSWSLYEGTIHEPGYAQFFCSGDASTFAAVEAKETREAGKRLYVYSTWMNHVPTNGELSNSRRLIDRICESVHQNVPNIPASSASQDKFMGVAGH